MRIRKIGLLGLLNMILALPVVGGGDKLTVIQWQPHDFEFKIKPTEGNPFLVDFSAEVTGPAGIKISLPGFYDGDNTWKIRFSATKAGTWTMITHSKLNGLNGQKIQFTCSLNKDQNIHGGLMTDPINKRHFLYEDGTHWFPMGYECNWLWALDADDNKLPTINTFLDKLSGYGFNFILINVYGYDTTWRLGKSSDDDYGPSPLYPWKGTNDHQDFSFLNITYWQHFDRMMDALYQHGIIAHLYFKVYNKKVNWPRNNSLEDDIYYKWIIARYAGYPNIIWDLAKEANNEKSVEYKVARVKFIRAADPYHHLLTVHTDTKTYDNGTYDDLLDFRSDQEQSDHLHATVIKQLAQSKWPVFNVESGYEQGPKGAGDKTYSHAEAAEEDALRIWQIQMAGGYNAYYYTYTAWDVIRPNDTPPGYLYLQYFKEFFISTKYWLLKPADELLSSGYCLANPTKEYVVFQDRPQAFTLNLTTIDKPMKVRWYHLFTGKYENGGFIKKGMVTITPPATFGVGPVVLHLVSSPN